MASGGLVCGHLLYEFALSCILVLQTSQPRAAGTRNQVY
jgi:hypothetical protein